MGVEQNGLGCFEIVSIFYEIEPIAGILGCITEFAEWDSGGAQERPLDGLTRFRCFITMKLHKGAGNQCARGCYFRSACVHEKQHGCYERR